MAHMLNLQVPVVALPLCFFLKQLSAKTSHCFNKLFENILITWGSHFSGSGFSENA